MLVVRAPRRTCISGEKPKRFIPSSVDLQSNEANTLETEELLYRILPSHIVNWITVIVKSQRLPKVGVNCELWLIHGTQVVDNSG